MEAAPNHERTLRLADTCCGSGLEGNRDRWRSGVWLRACQRPGRCSVASTSPCASSASIATTDRNGPGTVEANRFWLTGAEMTVLPEASIPVTVATPSAAKPANWISGGKTITGRAGDGKVPLRSQPTPLATFDSIAKQ